MVEWRKPSALEGGAFVLLLFVSGYLLLQFSLAAPDDPWIKIYNFVFILSCVFGIPAVLISISRDTSDDRLFLRFQGLGDFKKKVYGVPLPIVAALAGLGFALVAVSLNVGLLSFGEKPFAQQLGADLNRQAVGAALLEDTFDVGVLIPSIAGLFTLFGLVGGVLPILFLAFFELPLEIFFIVAAFAVLLVVGYRKAGLLWAKPSPQVALGAAILVVAVFFGLLHGYRSGWDFAYMLSAFQYRLLSSVLVFFVFGSIAFTYVLHSANNSINWIACKGSVGCQITGFSFEMLLAPLSIIGFVAAVYWISEKTELGRKWR